MNILTAIWQNKRILGQGTDSDKRAIALTWLFHLIGDVHPAFTLCRAVYARISQWRPEGNEIYVARCRAGQGWNYTVLDGFITSTSNVGSLSTIATELLSKFSKIGLRELGERRPEA